MASKNTNWQRYAIIAHHQFLKEATGCKVPFILVVADIVHPLCNLRVLERATAGSWESDFRSDADLDAARRIALCEATIPALALYKQHGDLDETLHPRDYTRLEKNLKVEIADKQSSIWEEALLRTSALINSSRVDANALLGVIVLLGMYADQYSINMHDMLGAWASALTCPDDE